MYFDELMFSLPTPLQYLPLWSLPLYSSDHADATTHPEMPEWQEKFSPSFFLIPARQLNRENLSYMFSFAYGKSYQRLFHSISFFPLITSRTVLFPLVPFAFSFPLFPHSLFSIFFHFVNSPCIESLLIF